MYQDSPVSSNCIYHSLERDNFTSPLLSSLSSLCSGHVSVGRKWWTGGTEGGHTIIAGRSTTGYFDLTSLPWQVWGNYRIRIIIINGLNLKSGKWFFLMSMKFQNIMKGNIGSYWIFWNWAWKIMVMMMMMIQFVRRWISIIAVGCGSSLLGLRSQVISILRIKSYKSQLWLFGQNNYRVYLIVLTNHCPPYNFSWLKTVWTSLLFKLRLYPGKPLAQSRKNEANRWL